MDSPKIGLRNALVAGASGLIGGYLLDELLERPQWKSISSLVRRPSGRHHEKLTEFVADFEHLQNAKLPDIDDAFIALGTTIKTAGSQEAFRQVDFDAILAVGRRARAAGAKRLVVVSSIGADATAKNFYLRVKGETEEALEKLGFTELHLLRPSMLYGPREESRPGERIGIALSRVIAPTLLGPLRPYRPIHAQKVAQAMVGCALAGGAGNHIHTYDNLLRLASRR